MLFFIIIISGSIIIIIIVIIIIIIVVVISIFIIIIIIIIVVVIVAVITTKDYGKLWKKASNDTSAQRLPKLDGYYGNLPHSEHFDTVTLIENQEGKTMNCIGSRVLLFFFLVFNQICKLQFLLLLLLLLLLLEVITTGF